MGIFGLKDALGGTLRQCLCTKESLSFDNTNVVDLGDYDWVRELSVDKYHWYASPTVAGGKPAGKVLCTHYASSNKGNIYSGTRGIAIGPTGDSRFYIYDPDFDSSSISNTMFKAHVKGMLCAYEKSSS